MSSAGWDVILSVAKDLSLSEPRPSVSKDLSLLEPHFRPLDDEPLAANSARAGRPAHIAHYCLLIVPLTSTPLSF